MKEVSKMGKLVTCFNISCDSTLSFQTVQAMYQEGEELLCPKCQSTLVDRCGNVLMNQYKLSEETPSHEWLAIDLSDDEGEGT